MNLITDLNQKKKFLSSAKKNGQQFIRIKLKDDFWNKKIIEKNLYLDTNDMKGNKRIYNIPFSDFICKDWKHLSMTTKSSTSNLLKGVDIYNETIEPLTKEEVIEIQQIEKLIK